MTRWLLITSLLGESAILFLGAGRMPYPTAVQVMAGALGLTGVALLVGPALCRPEERPLEFHSDRVVLGRGTSWGTEEAQRLMEDPTLEPGATPIHLPVGDLDQHVLITGVTGAGKSRMMELLIVQAIRRGEAGIVIDPKGDDRLLQTVASESIVQLFSLTDPRRSVPYNPVSQFTHPREVADRMASLLPAGESRPWRDYAWQMVQILASALVVAGEPVSLSALRRDPWEIVCLLIRKHTGGGIHGSDGAKLAKTYERHVRDGATASLPELDALISLARRPRDHHAKMTSGLEAVLGQLTSNPVLGGDGLVWDDVTEGQVVYCHLGSLVSGDSAAAVAKLMLLDLKSTVGRRYARKERTPLNIFIDEAAMVVTEAAVPLMSQGRGAGVRITLAAQTLSDFEVALGSRSAAEQVIGNVSTVIAYRASSQKDAEVFSNLAGERGLMVSSEAARYEPSLFSSGFRSVEDFRASFGISQQWSTEPLVPPWVLMNLPKFCFMAKSPDGIRFGRALCFGS